MDTTKYKAHYKPLKEKKIKYTRKPCTQGNEQWDHYDLQSSEGWGWSQEDFEEEKTSESEQGVQAFLEVTHDLNREAVVGQVMKMVHVQKKKKKDGKSISVLSGIMIVILECLNSIQGGNHWVFSDKGVACVVIFKEK